MSAIQTAATTGWNAISTAVTTVMTTIRAAVAAGWNAIQVKVSLVVNAVRTAVTTGWNAVSTAVTTVMTTIRNAVATGWNAIQGKVSQVMNAVRTAVGIGWNAISTAMGNILGASASTGLRGLVNSVWGGIKSIIENTFQGFRTSVNTFIGVVNAAIRAWNAVAPAGLQVPTIPEIPALRFSSTTTLSTQVNSTALAAVAATEALAEDVGEAAAGVGPNIVNALVTGIGAVTDFASRVGTIVAGWVNAISWPPFTAAGVSFVTELVDAITAAGSTFRSALESFINAAVCAVIGCSPDGSAARRIKGGGERMVELLIEGLRRKAPALQAGLKGLVEAAGAGLGAVNVGTTLLPAGGNLPGGVGGLATLSPVTVGATLGAGQTSQGIGRQINMGGQIFQTTIHNSIDAAEFQLMLEEGLRRIINI
jgi:hypothetical protein